MFIFKRVIHKLRCAAQRTHLKQIKRHTLKCRVFIGRSLIASGCLKKFHGLLCTIKRTKSFQKLLLDNTNFLDRETATQEVVSAIKLDVVFKAAGLAAILREMYERNVQESHDILHATVHPANDLIKVEF